jgi:hypothetical protein
MSSEVQKAVIRFLNDQVRSCKSDEDYMKLAGKLVAKNISKKKFLEKLGLEPEEEVTDPVTPADDGADNTDPDAE